MTVRHDKGIAPPNDFYLVSATTVASDTTLSAVTGVGSALVRGLLVGQAGYLDVVMKNGNVCNGLPFQAGINPGYFLTVKTSVGTGAAQNVWVII